MNRTVWTICFHQKISQDQTSSDRESIVRRGEYSILEPTLRDSFGPEYKIFIHYKIATEKHF